jgi:hypothetical protein
VRFQDTGCFRIGNFLFGERNSFAQSLLLLLRRPFRREREQRLKLHQE